MAKPNTWYSINGPSGDRHDVYDVHKFDADHNPIMVYKIHTTSHTCTCPAFRSNTCRHRAMLPLFLSEERINSGWFYDYDRNIYSLTFSVRF